ncbi:cobalamin biosynthesis protein [Camelimonas lactis]|uniref:Cobalt-precorrin 5A hydrolase n=1 Tax=Camelimonas lactis TaxID=659006 RepID=A0A4R2GWE3_9HYPH|nr:cobalamin biosynthesis protein [Camelimonas lactis]TCO15146.1 cobalt-precorrin 5A hydrolase [Camelimonas lactis]
MSARAVCSAGVCIAGVGCRVSASVDDILAVIAQALKRDGLRPENLTALACIPARAEHPAIQAAAARLGLSLVVADPAALAAMAGACLTRSDAALAATGLPSASEAAALAAACAIDANARLAGPRSAGPMATCAIACSPAVLHHLDQQ